MKKIVFCIGNLNVGGIESAAINYIKNIDNKKYDISLFMEQKSGEYLSEVPQHVHIINYNICTIKFSLIRKIVNAGKLLYFTIKYYHKFDFSCCFATSVKSCAILAKNFSYNNALWFHGHYWDSLDDANFFLKYVRADKYKKYVFVSNHLKNEFLKVRPKCKKEMFVLNNPINALEILSKSDAAIDYKKPKCSCLVNISRHEDKFKNLYMLFRVVKRLVNDGYKFELLMIGDGPDHDDYIKYIKDNKLDKIVKFVGRKNNVFPYYKISDAVLLTSISEGNPVVFLEAKVMNKPVITTDVSDAKLDIAGNYGLVSNNNEEDYYLCLKSFLDNGIKIKRFDYKDYNSEIIRKFEDVVR